MFILIFGFLLLVFVFRMMAGILRWTFRWSMSMPSAGTRLAAFTLSGLILGSLAFVLLYHSFPEEPPVVPGKIPPVLSNPWKETPQGNPAAIGRPGDPVRHSEGHDRTGRPGIVASSARNCPALASRSIFCTGNEWANYDWTHPIWRYSVCNEPAIKARMYNTPCWADPHISFWIETNNLGGGLTGAQIRACLARHRGPIPPARVWLAKCSLVADKGLSGSPRRDGGIRQ
ncbi:MAG: hypothetical protein ACYDBP_04225 [Leptospirales bacterium]